MPLASLTGLDVPISTSRPEAYGLSARRPSAAPARLVLARGSPARSLAPSRQRSPSPGLDLDPKPPGGGANPSPRRVAFAVGHALHLVETHDRVAHVLRIADWLL